MNNSDILLHLHCNKPIILDHNCNTENDIQDDDIILIDEIIGNFDQLKVSNQYSQSFIINPNQII